MAEAKTITKLRLTITEAAEMLSIDYETLRRVVATGLFTTNGPRGRGPGKRVFLTDPREIEAYATGGEDGVREYQARKARGGGNADSVKARSPFRGNN